MADETAPQAGSAAPVGGMLTKADDDASIMFRPSMRARLLALHQPTEEEAERYHRPGDLEGDCPEPDMWRLSDPCPGHLMMVTVCSECGYSHDGDLPVYRSWPCPTVVIANGS